MAFRHLKHHLQNPLLRDASQTSSIRKGRRERKKNGRQKKERENGCRLKGTEGDKTSSKGVAVTIPTLAVMKSNLVLR